MLGSCVHVEVGDEVDVADPVEGSGVEGGGEWRGEGKDWMILHTCTVCVCVCVCVCD